MLEKKLKKVVSTLFEYTKVVIKISVLEQPVY